MDNLADTSRPGGNVLTSIKGYVERIERLAEEGKAIRDDIKDIYGEAKVAGLDLPVLRALVAKRKKDADKQKELERLLAIYEKAMET